MAKDYQTFLKETRDRVSALVVEDNAVKKRFADQIGKVSDLYETYKEAYKRQLEKLAKWGKTKAARDHSRKFQEWEKKREADQNAGQPPVGPVFPEDELPPNPLAWFGLRPECTLTDSQKSTRFYSLLGIVHDGYTWEHGGRFEYIRKDLRKKDTILDSMWWCGQLRKDPQYEGLIEEALTYVKKDIAGNPPETEEDATSDKEKKADVNIHISGGIQAENVQIGNHASIQKQPKTEKSKGKVKSIFTIVSFLAALLTCIYLLWWLWTQFLA